MFRSGWRKVTAPLNKLGCTIKRKAERFVLKTIAKNPTTCSQSASSTLSPTGQPSMQFLLPLLRAANRPSSSSPLFDVVPISDEWLLTRHPVTNYVFADKVELLQLPSILMNQYQPRETASIEREFEGAASVVHLNAGFGYHTLTIANGMSPNGNVWALETNPQHRATLDLNIRSHQLQSMVSIPKVSGNVGELRDVLRTLPGAMVYITCDRQLPQAWSEELCECALENPAMQVWCGCERIHSEQMQQRMKPMTRAAMHRAA